MLVPNELYEDAVEDARMLESWLDDLGCDVVRPPVWGFDGGADLSGVDLVVSLGGDGTLLRAAHLVGELEIPILGLSYGHLGFLTREPDGCDVRAVVAQALAGELHASRRAALSVVLYGTDAAGEPVEVEGLALNEVVLARGASGKMVEFDVEANGVHVDRLRGDGFVVATATGSTGYALSAGGPIVTPDFGGLVCVPIAPHTITARAFVTSPSDVVELAVAADRSYDRCVFADGEPFASDVVPERLRVSRAAHEVVLLGGGADDFFTSVSRVFYGKVR
jgi:NAD+ kinase